MANRKPRKMEWYDYRLEEDVRLYRLAMDMRDILNKLRRLEATVAKPAKRPLTPRDRDRLQDRRGNLAYRLYRMARPLAGLARRHLGPDIASTARAEGPTVWRLSAQARMIPEDLKPFTDTRAGWDQAEVDAGWLLSLDLAMRGTDNIPTVATFRLCWIHDDLTARAKALTARIKALPVQEPHWPTGLPCPPPAPWPDPSSYFQKGLR